MNINNHIKKSDIKFQYNDIGLNSPKSGDLSINDIFNVNNKNIQVNYPFLTDKNFQNQDNLFESFNGNNDYSGIQLDKPKNRSKVNSSVKPDIIKKLLFNDLNSKPLSDEDFLEHVQKITKDNVRQVLSLYKNQNKNGGVFSSVINNTELNINTKKEAILHIAGKLSEYCGEKGIKSDDILKDLEGELNQTCLIKTKGKRLDEIAERFESRIQQTNKDNSEKKAKGGLKSLIAPDGKIDGNFRQNDLGDCWLLSGLKSISNNPKTLQMMNDNLKYNDKDGSVTVTLKGANKTYTVTKEELYGSSEFAKGDLDIRAVEIATNRHFQEEYHKSSKSLCKINPPKPDINGNSSLKAYELLLGIKGEHVFVKKDNASDFIKNYVKDNNHLVVVSRHFKPNERINDAKGNSVLVYSHHAYSVAGADDKFVYIVNPHDSSKKIPLTHSQFGKLFDEADVAKIPE